MINMDISLRMYVISDLLKHFSRHLEDALYKTICIILCYAVHVNSVRTISENIFEIVAR